MEYTVKNIYDYIKHNSSIYGCHARYVYYIHLDKEGNLVNKTSIPDDYDDFDFNNIYKTFRLCIYEDDYRINNAADESEGAERCIAQILTEKINKWLNTPIEERSTKTVEEFFVYGKAPWSEKNGNLINFNRKEMWDSLEKMQIAFIDSINILQYFKEKIFDNMDYDKR